MSNLCYVTTQIKVLLSLLKDWRVLFAVLGNNWCSKIQSLRKMIIEMILTASVDIFTVLTGKDWPKMYVENLNYNQVTNDFVLNV